jgi:hypothetical protein
VSWLALKVPTKHYHRFPRWYYEFLELHVVEEEVAEEKAAEEAEKTEKV